MFTKLVTALALFALMGFQAQAQETELQRIADALDVSTTKTFQFTGNGTMYSLGQNTSPAAAWPRQFVKSMTRVYDFTAAAMRDEIVRMAGETLPIGPEQQVIQVVSGEYAWNVVGKDIVHRVWETAERQHQIWYVAPWRYARRLRQQRHGDQADHRRPADDGGFICRKGQTESYRLRQRSERHRAGRLLVRPPGYRRHESRDLFWRLPRLCRRQVSQQDHSIPRRLDHFGSDGHCGARQPTGGH